MVIHPVLYKQGVTRFLFVSDEEITSVTTNRKHIEMRLPVISISVDPNICPIFGIYIFSFAKSYPYSNTFFTKTKIIVQLNTKTTETKV